MKIHVGKAGWVWRIIVVGILVVLMQAPISHLHPFYDSVNAVVGDESYLNAFGELPDQTASEHVRIQTHLTYVEALLRNQSVAHLTPEKRKQRLALLEHLRRYREAGVFPQRQDGYPNRRPCFIDDSGNICAVGYLVEQTAGRDLAEQINAQYQYAYLWDMQNDNLNEWVDESGFSLKELAMIQPTYQGSPSTPCTFDFEDFIGFVQAFNTKDGDALYHPNFDLNLDRVINFSDFIFVAQRFDTSSPKFNILGQIQEGQKKIIGVKLSIKDGLGFCRAVETDSLGNYTYPNLPMGIHLLVPQKEGYRFVPETLRIKLLDRGALERDILGQNFEAIPTQPLLTEHVSNRN